jgi:S1-C subfamily serine protease
MPIMQDWYRPPADQRIDPAPLPTRITPQQPSPAVVQINSQRGDTGLQGTGTIVSLDNGVATIVSCAHILKAGYSVLILFSDGTSSSAEIVSTDAMFDTSVLRAKAPATARLMHIANPPAIGDSIGWCGHAGTGYTSGNAKVLGYDGDLLVITGNVPEGTSGGPIYTPM